uniref:Uncharacterized protein n=1 Tax=Prolemur simus TaxID=1328070 RepID=A0A8C9ABU1_PROSS
MVAGVGRVAALWALRRRAGHLLASAAAESVAATAAPAAARRQPEGSGRWVPRGAPRFSSAAAAMAPVKVGGDIPSVEVFEGEPGNKVNLCKGKKGVLFRVPGASTPGCKVRLLADPTGAFGKDTDLLLGNSLVALFGNPRLKRSEEPHSSEGPAHTHWEEVCLPCIHVK